ncbi:MAG TPA: hypothetical protein VJU53_06445 [Burkholderiaceae bacterium]|nr:hypothetical protein [Burkholderiaceae bacterium]
MTTLPLLSVFARADSFDGFAALTSRETLDPLPFEAGAFTLRAGAFAFLAKGFLAVFLTTFFAALPADLAAFLAGFFAAMSKPL